MAALKCSSSFVSGKAVRAARPSVAARPVRSVKVQAKYGENSKYFDLTDMENTTGSWDMYGQDSDKRYPAMQAEFFNRAGAALGRREALVGVIALFGIGSIATFGLKGAADADLPITKGPQTAGENGKGGTLRSRL